MGQTRPTVIEQIQIPDASTEPANYVKALLDLVGDRDPIEILSKTPADVESLIDHADIEVLRAQAGAGDWSFRDVLGHLLDVDIVYGFRFRLVLTADQPTYPGYDEKRFARLPKLDVTGLAVAFRWLRTANLELLQRLTPEQWEKRGVHGEQGIEDVRLMVHKLAGHDIAHINQMMRTAQTSNEPTSISRDSAEDLLRQAERAFAAQDLDAICMLFTDDVVARYAGSPAIHGKKQLREHLDRRLRAQKGYQPAKSLTAVSGSVIVDSWEGTWIDADSGVRMAGRGIEVLKLRGGLVAELDAVFLPWPV
jgi:nuclear transport factor 2 (NTF2) superfamily protein